MTPLGRRVTCGFDELACLDAVSWLALALPLGVAPRPVVTLTSPRDGPCPPPADGVPALPDARRGVLIGLPGKVLGVAAVPPSSCAA